MKRSLLILLLFLGFVTTSCRKHQSLCCVLPKPPEAIAASKAGINWKAPSQISYTNPNNTDTVSLSGHVGEENINFILKKTDASHYTLVDATYFTTVGQDAIVSSYGLDKSKNNTFTSMIFGDGKITEGIFTLYFSRTYGSPVTAYPDTLSFKNGYYRATWPSK